MASASITSQRCTVCRHADRLAIEHTLACGGGQNATAERFGLSKDSVSRHWANHVSDTWKASAQIGPFRSRDQLERICLDHEINVVEALRALYSAHQMAFIANLEAGSVEKLIVISREMRDILSEISRIAEKLLADRMPRL